MNITNRAATLAEIIIFSAIWLWNGWQFVVEAAAK